MQDNISGGYNEVELLTRLGNGDKYAFELLYNQYKYRIAGNLLKLLKSEDLAEEILQDLFVKIWDTRKTIDPQKSFRSYLFRIAENMVMDYYRKASRDKRIQDKLMAATAESYSHIEEHIFNKESELLLYNAIELLPPQRKQVFTLCKLEGKSYKEVSELLGISHSTINDHLLKSNRFLKQHLNPQSGTVLSGVVAAILFGI
uniref:RNA polymerase sigma factor n=1 Tax=Pedobacter schmidteae TaxID=2201271 RepID=UPI000EB1CC5A|nr:RNA polymerase sigma-70 factor [Pedobacter schmidteae]